MNNEVKLNQTSSARPEAPAVANIEVAAPQVVATLGARVTDSAAIEQLAGGQMLLWNQGCETTGREITHNQITYRPVPLDPVLECSLHLPSHSAAYGTVKALVEELAGAVSTASELDSQSAFLIATFILSTWVIDALPTAACLNPWGHDGADASLMPTLSCLCRRPVSLSTPRIGELAILPAGLTPTVILNNPAERPLQTLFAMLSEGGMVLLGGRAVSLRAALIARTRRALDVPAVSVSLARPHPYHRLTATEVTALVDQFLPRLLRFRLERIVAVAESQFDVSGFASPTRLVARALGSTLEGFPDLQQRLVAALQISDEKMRVQQSQSLPAVVLETLLALCHEHKTAAFVGEVTELTNSLLLGRGAGQKLTPRGLGEILRELGLPVRRRGAGYELVLNGHQQQQLHELAASYGVLTIRSGLAKCTLCASVAGDGEPSEAGLRDSNGDGGVRIGNVQDVQDVHDVPDERVS